MLLRFQMLSSIKNCMHKIFDTSNLNFETGEETEQSEIKQHSLLLEAGLQFCGMVYASAIYTQGSLVSKEGAMEGIKHLDTAMLECGKTGR